LVVNSIALWSIARETPIVNIIADSGTGYQDFSSIDQCKRIADIAKVYRGRHYIISALGTNNIYSPGKALTPTEYIDEVKKMVANIITELGSYTLVLSIPPKANESIFPVVKAGYTYEDYVFAICMYASESDFGVIRNDLAEISYGKHYADGVHPNDAGHDGMANTYCQFLNIPTIIENLSNDAEEVDYKISTKIVAITLKEENISLGVGWDIFALNTPIKYKITPILYMLGGLIKPKAGNTTDKVLATLNNYSASSTTYTSASANTGTVVINITPNGEITLEESTIPAWISFDGVVFLKN